MRKPRHRPTDPCLMVEPLDKIICDRCMRWHFPPKCSWDTDLLCPACNLPVWYKGDDAQPGPECYYCWSGFPRRVCAAPEPRVSEEPDWLKNLGAG
jgi:hypothetical protein